MIREKNEYTKKDAPYNAMEIFIRSGELYFGSAPTVISTMLHSRIAISFWHPRARIGGMCHIALPDSPPEKCNMDYADCAITEFARLANKYHTAPGEYEVRIFTRAGNPVETEEWALDKSDTSGYIKIVKELLKQNKFSVTELDITRSRSRKLRLNLTDGSVARITFDEKAHNHKKTHKHGSERGANVDVMEIFLHPGELYFGRSPTVISTLLGSCVAVTLWHPKEKIGGMCHIVLPESQPGKFELRYADCAIGELVKQATKFNTRTKDYIVNIYGGSDMFPGMFKSSGMRIGDRNIEKVTRLLEVYMFHVNEVDIGGNNSRKIKLDLSDGSVGIRKTSKSIEG